MWWEAENREKKNPEEMIKDEFPNWKIELGFLSEIFFRSYFISNIWYIPPLTWLIVGSSWFNVSWQVTKDSQKRPEEGRGDGATSKVKAKAEQRKRKESDTGRKQNEPSYDNRCVLARGSTSTCNGYCIQTFFSQLLPPGILLFWILFCAKKAVFHDNNSCVTNRQIDG